MLVDSHCHLNFIDLTEFNNDIAQVLSRANENGVEHFLCVCVELSDYPQLEHLAANNHNISISTSELSLKTQIQKRHTKYTIGDYICVLNPSFHLYTASNRCIIIRIFAKELYASVCQAIDATQGCR